MDKFIVFVFLLLVIACGGHTSSSEANETNGLAIYKKYCITCHGSDGKLALNGAKDITVSPLSEEERVELVIRGKNTMMPFGSILSPEEIRAVVAYTLTLKN